MSVTEDWTGAAGFVTAAREIAGRHSENPCGNDEASDGIVDRDAGFPDSIVTLLCFSEVSIAAC